MSTARQLAGEHVVEDEYPMLRPRIQLDRLPFHVVEGDEVAGRLSVTESLAVHRTLAGY
jgi:hypothetical protein